MWNEDITGTALFFSKITITPELGFSLTIMKAPDLGSNQNWQKYNVSWTEHSFTSQKTKVMALKFTWILSFIENIQI